MTKLCRVLTTVTATALVAACAQPVQAPPPPPPPPPPVVVAPPPPPPAAPAWGAKPVVGKFSCDIGRTVSVDAKDDNNVDLQWQGKTYAMAKVPTSSGAMRFEDKASGLVWIQIPAKSMLMDSKAGRQLAQDCRN